ncbi:DUF4124 domain-containing protein [Pseudomonas aeruginosa]|nr:DUF4124 domain-containing protein [Pseudomonas aeruginosa]
MKRIFPVLALAMVACSSQAATVFKCVGPDGKVTFTQHNCPENQSLDDVVSATNQRPSGTGASAVMAKLSRRRGAPIGVSQTLLDLSVVA